MRKKKIKETEKQKKKTNKKEITNENNTNKRLHQK